LIGKHVWGLTFRITLKRSVEPAVREDIERHLEHARSVSDDSGFDGAKHFEF